MDKIDCLFHPDLFTCVLLFCPGLCIFHHLCIQWKHQHTWMKKIIYYLCRYFLKLLCVLFHNPCWTAIYSRTNKLNTKSRFWSRYSLSFMLGRVPLNLTHWSFKLKLFTTQSSFPCVFLPPFMKLGYGELKKLHWEVTYIVICVSVCAKQKGDTVWLCDSSSRSVLDHEPASCQRQQTKDSSISSLHLTLRINV